MHIDILLHEMLCSGIIICTIIWGLNLYSNHTGNHLKSISELTFPHKWIDLA